MKGKKKVITRISIIAVVLTAILIAGYFYQLNKKTKPVYNGSFVFQLKENWPQLPKDFTLGNPTGLGIDTFQNLVVFHRAGREWPTFGTMPSEPILQNTILVLNGTSGKILKQWGDSLFIMPHGLTVDGQNNIWVTDVGLHQVFKFSYEGRLLMKLGEAAVAGNDSLHFNKPTDVAIADDGSFYVSDGYGNSRIVKFSAAGNYLFEWGNKGDGEGKFDTPHGMTLDAKGNVYVADRENNRVQVFDSTGGFLKQWKDESVGGMCSVTYDKVNKNIIAIDDAQYLKVMHLGSDVILLDSAGVVANRFGRSGNYNGSKCWYHDVVVDREGNIYVGDIMNDRLQKFVLKYK